MRGKGRVCCPGAFFFWWKFVLSGLLLLLLLLPRRSVVADMEYDDQQNSCPSSQGTAETQQEEPQKQCSIYMAPSSLKGLEGNGIFTTRDLNTDDFILQAATDGPSIVVTDYDQWIDEDVWVQHWIDVWNHYWWGRGVGDHATYEVAEGQRVVDFQITFGSLPNHHCLLDSITHRYPDIPYDDRYPVHWPGAGAHSYHTGRDFVVSRPVPAGSELFLHYGHCQRRQKQQQSAAEDEEAEEEEQHPTQPEWTQFSRMTEDYQRAVDVVTTLWNVLYYYDDTQALRREYEQHRDHLDEYMGTPLLEHSLLVQGVLYQAGLLTGSHANQTSPLWSLIPTTTGELMRIMDPYIPEHDHPNENEKENDNQDKNHRRLFQIRVPEWEQLAERLERQLAMHTATGDRADPDWIRQHGMCLEHLVGQPSPNVPEAGQGAIAQHYIAQGEIVVPAPTLHILDERALLRTITPDERTPNSDDGETGVVEEEDRDDESYQQYQLLLNYCFGHNATTLLVCPVTNAILINHCSDRPNFPCPKISNDSNSNQSTAAAAPPFSGPNAKVQWTTGPDTWDPNTERWLNMTIPELLQQPTTVRGLSMEVIALRDIAPGEEVFIDYGPEWERSWTRHVQDWNLKNNNLRRTGRPSVTELNQKIDEEHAPLEWLVGDDIVQRPKEHEYMETRCIYWVTDQDSAPIYHGQVVTDDDENPIAVTEEELVDWTEWEDDNEILDVFGDFGGDFVGEYKHHEEHVYWPCSVYENAHQDDGSDPRTYTVRILPPSPDHHDLPPWAVNDWPRFLVDYPLTSIRYFVRPTQSDQHLRHAFRHPIGLPSDMIPEQWKNRKLQ